MVRLSLVVVALAVSDGGTPAAPAAFADGKPVKDGIVLPKGKTVIVSSAPSAIWSVEPSGTVELTDLGGGRTQIKALKDWFDETPNREPVAMVRACLPAARSPDGRGQAGVSGACTVFTVTCLIDSAGTWKLALVGKWLGIFDHQEDRTPVFVQNGRDVSFEDRVKDAEPPFKIVRLRLNGNSLQLKDGGGSLKEFSGTLKDRRNGEGKFDSFLGFSGNWTAARQ